VRVYTLLPPDVGVDARDLRKNTATSAKLGPAGGMPNSSSAYFQRIDIGPPRHVDRGARNVKGRRLSPSAALTARRAISGHCAADSDITTVKDLKGRLLATANRRILCREW